MADKSDDLSFKDFFGMSKEPGDGNAQEVVVNHIFVACAGENNTIVHADQLISFITPFLKDNITAVEKLRKTLDPNNLNQEIDLNQFHYLMEAWISGMKVEDDLHNITPRDSQLLADLSYTQSTPKTNFGHHKLKECIESGIINTTISPSSYSIHESSSTNKGPEKTILEEQIQELVYQKKRMSEEIDRMKIELANSLETNESIQVRLEQALIKVIEKQKFIETLQQLTQSKDDDNNIELEKMKKLSAGLETKVLSLETKIIALNEELAELQTENEKLEKGNKQLWKENDACLEEMLSLQNKIDVLKQDYAIQQQYCDALNEKQRELEDNNEEYACTIEKLKFEKAALQNVVKPNTRKSLDSNIKLATAFACSNSTSEYSPIAQQILKKHAYNTPKTMFKLKNPVSPLLSDEKIKLSPRSNTTTTPKEVSTKCLIDSELQTLNNTHTILQPTKSEEFEFDSPPVMYVVERSGHKYNYKKNRSCDDLLGMVVVSNLNENLHEEINQATSEKKMLSYTFDNSSDENPFEIDEEYPSLHSEINDINSAVNVQDFKDENISKKQIKELKEKLNELQNEVDKYKNENETLKIRYENEIANLSKEKESILDRLKCIERGEIEIALEEASCDLMSNIRESKKKLSTKRSNYDKLIFKNSKLEQKNFDLEDKLLEKKNRLEEAVTQKKLVEDKLKKVEEENCEVEKRLKLGFDELLFKNGELEQKIFDLKDKLSKVNEENLRVEEQLRSDYGQLLFENAELKQKVNDLEEKLLAEKNLLFEAVTQNKFVEEKLKKVEKENCEVEERLKLGWDELLFKNGKLEEKVCDLEDKLNKVNEENQRVEEQLRSDYDQLLFENTELQQKVCDLREKLLGEKNLLVKAVTQNKFVEEKLKKVEEEKCVVEERLKLGWDELLSQNEKLEQKVFDLEVKLCKGNEENLRVEEKLKSDYDQLLFKNTGLEEKVSDLEAKLSNSNEKNLQVEEKLRSDYDQLLFKKTELEQRSFDLEAQNKSLEDKFKKINEDNLQLEKELNSIKNENNFDSLNVEVQKYTESLSQNRINLENSTLTLIKYFSIPDDLIRKILKNEPFCLNESESLLNLEKQILSVIEQMEISSNVLNFLYSQKSKISFKSESCQTEISLETEDASVLPKLVDQNLESNLDVAISKMQEENKDIGLQVDSKCFFLEESSVMETHISPRPRCRVIRMVTNFFTGWMIFMGIFCLIISCFCLILCEHNYIDNPWIPFVEKRYIRPPPT